jgi:cell division protein FtsB
MDQNRYQIQFEKDKAFLKAFLQGRNYQVALKALGFIERETAGKFRKDGVMPEMHHMVRLALDATQLGLPYQNGLVEPINGKYSMSIEERLITTLLFHDVIEDDKSGTIDRDTIRNLSRLYISESVWLMTKKFRGEKKDKKEYITELGENLISALGKGIDRNDNLEHMIGVFDLPKLIDYVHEAETEHYPMLKRASKLFPEHMREFQIVMYRMKRNIKFINHYITSQKQTAAYQKAIQTLDPNVAKLEAKIVQLNVENEQLAKEKLEINEHLKAAKSSSMESVLKVMKVFGNVSPQHKYLLQQKLCSEFGVSFLEMSKLTSEISEVENGVKQTTNPNSVVRPTLIDDYRKSLASDN